MSLQLRSAIFAMRERRSLSFAPTEKSPFVWRRLFDCRDRRITQDKFFQFIGHTSVRLQEPSAGVYDPIQGVS
jgi:hypothetical protein